MDSVKVHRVYDSGQTFYTPWVAERDMFCPSCGKNGVWRCDDGGGHYMGESHVCIECQVEFYLPLVIPFTRRCASAIKQIKAATKSD